MRGFMQLYNVINYVIDIRWYILLYLLHPISPFPIILQETNANLIILHNTQVSFQLCNTGFSSRPQPLTMTTIAVHINVSGFTIKCYISSVSSIL